MNNGVRMLEKFDAKFWGGNDALIFLTGGNVGWEMQMHLEERWPGGGLKKNIWRMCT